MDIFIVAIDDHRSQLVEAATDSDQDSARKQALRQRIRAILMEHNVAAILEEQSPDRLTIACQLAYQNSPAIPWHGINMTDDERRKFGIYDDLLHRPYRLDWENGRPTDLVWERIPAADGILETFFSSQIIKIMRAIDSDGAALVLLGNGHVTAVAEQLSAMGHTVAVVGISAQ